MKKNVAAFMTLFAFLPLLVGMGAFQGQSPEKIPVPAKKFVATFVDQTDVITDLKDVSIEGGTFLDGSRGEGTITISFDNISEVSFRLEGEKLKGIINLRDGHTVELILNKNQRAYGQTKYGTFQIKLSDLKKITLNKAR
jgi:hypothetical protein